MFKIIDWAGNEIKTPNDFESFEDGEEYLCEKLGDKYEDERGEYYVVEACEVKPKRYLHLGRN